MAINYTVMQMVTVSLVSFCGRVLEIGKNVFQGGNYFTDGLGYIKQVVLGRFSNLETNLEILDHARSENGIARMNDGESDSVNQSSNGEKHTIKRGLKL